MSEAAASVGVNRAPWHFWVAGLLTLIWNAFGCVDYVLTETRNADYFAAIGVTPEVAAYYASLPAWHVAVWAIGVWGALLGALALLLRRGLALWLFVISLAAMIVGAGVPLLDAETRALSGQTGLIMACVIFVVGVLEVIYAAAMKKRGVLR